MGVAISPTPVPAAAAPVDTEIKIAIAEPGSAPCIATPKAEPKPKPQSRRRTRRRLMAGEAPETEEGWRALTLSECIEIKRALKRRQYGGWTASAQRQWNATMGVVTDVLGRDRAMREIRETDIRGLLDTINELPSNWNKSPHERRSTPAIVADAQEKEEVAFDEIDRRAALEPEKWTRKTIEEAKAAKAYKRLAPNTLYRHHVFINEVFAFFADKGGAPNPVKDVKMTKRQLKDLNRRRGHGRLAWGPDGLAALFGRPIFVEGPEKPDDFHFWGPLLNRYAGLRLEEAAQLRLEDITTVEGVPLIHVREGPGQHVKSATSIRVVPIHPELERLGLMRLAAQLCAANETWLFPNLDKGTDGTFSSIWTKRFHRWRVREGIYHPKKDIHSLRSDFYQSLKKGGVDYAARQVLMGHAINDVSEECYGRREYGLDQLYAFICCIPNDTKHVEPCLAGAQSAPGEDDAHDAGTRGGLL
jgi:integrase